MINPKVISKVLGVLLSIICLFQGFTTLYAFAADCESWKNLAISTLISLAGSALFLLLGKGAKDNVYKRDGYLIVTLGWVLMSSFSMVPFLLSGHFDGVVDAYFETMSGLTTTGASILNDIESLPKGILLWRSLTQWIGGMGIIVLTIAIFPILGIGGFELFVAEAPGPTSDRLAPRITDTAKILWSIYLGLTLLLSFIFRFLGMSNFDAINHALTTMATGGFSTKNSSMIDFSPAIQYVTCWFMLLAGINYSILFLLLTGRLKKAFYNTEFKTYLFVVGICTTLLTLWVHNISNTEWEESFRMVVFQVVSLITTTGFVSADYTMWNPGITMFFFMLLFMGASAGSTSGGIKIIRHSILFKNTFLEFKRLLHPKGLIRVKLNKKIVSPKVITHIIIFLLVYLGTFSMGTVIVAAMGLDFESAIGAVATSLGNVGPAIGSVGPMDNFAHLSDPIKLFLSFIMLVGRLELFSVLILFTPYYWRIN